MDYIPIDATAKVEVVVSNQGEICENVFHVKNITQFSSAQLLTLATTFHTWWVDEIQSLVGSTTILQRVDATDLHIQSGTKRTYGEGSPVAGTKSGNLMPNNVTVAIKWVTDSRGRSYRGRTYHIGLQEDQVAGNLVSTAHLAELEAAYAQLLAVVNVNPFTLVVASRFANKQPRTSGIVTPITGLSINQTVDTQRRRLPR